MRVDLSHAPRDGLEAFPGFPPLRVSDWLSHEESRSRYQGRAEFLIALVEAVGCVGTYLDSPHHRFREGEDLADLELGRVAALPGLVVDVCGFAGDPWSGPVDASTLVAAGLGSDGAGEGRAVLVRTGWDRPFGTPSYFVRPPYLTAAALDRLLSAGAALVGVDFGNVDDTRDLTRPAHTALLAAGVPIVENLRGLEDVTSPTFRFFAAPLAIVGGGSWPVRAFAEIRA